MRVKSIQNVKKLTGKKILLRASFNVPVRMSPRSSRRAESDILDDYKIVAGLPTIRFLLRNRCKIIIATHIGRPLRSQKPKAKSQKYKFRNQYSVKPVADYLSKVLGQKVKFVDEAVGFKVGTEASKLKNGEILMLENLRFYEGEAKNDKKFAKELSNLADIYVNDAFSVSHRKHASVCAIKKYLPSYAGILLKNEIENLNKILRPKEPLILIVGGIKVATKIKLIKKFSKISHRILIGGALANNFFAAHKLEIGKSIADRRSIKFAKSFKNKNIILPIDVIVCGKKDGTGKAVAKNVYDVRKNEIILDIGPQTVMLYNSFIKKAKTIIWNGPMGMFEKEHFKHGTLAMARIIASRSGGSVFGVVGGGETVEALKMVKMIDYVDWVSTGGGAMLAYLGGERMPGLKGIIKQ